MKRGDCATSRALAVAIRGIRVGLGITQRQMEKQTGLDRTYLSRIENGHNVPQTEAIEQIARGLGISPRTLIQIAEGLRDADKAMPTV